MFKFNHDFNSRFRILKGGKISLVVSALLGSAIIASAAPTGGVVTSGSANISQNGNVTNINQSSQKASINWQDFSIKSNETVNFNQPNINSITLNRVVGNEKSVINGALNANGQVWILNSNGILFSKDAKVNTSGVVASTAELSDKDFQDGNYNFKNTTSNSVVNLGTIEVSNNGYVVLASNEVRNSGTIKAIKGKVHLSGAKEYTINLNGNSIVNLVVTKGVLDAMVENSGSVIANGGEIYLTTNAVNELLKGVVNNTGILEANSIDDLSGKVEVFAHGGTANVSGEIKAEGGFVETSGDKVKIADDFKVKSNTWLIDPKDFTIAASGGDISGATLSSNLVNNHVVINSIDGVTEGNGDIFVNDDITWSSGKILELNARRNIHINATLDASGGLGGIVSLRYGQGAINTGNTASYDFGLTDDGFTGKIKLQSGQNFKTQLGYDGAWVNYTVYNSLNDLQTINNNSTTLKGNYALGSSLDFLTFSGTWNPIGENSNGGFNGRFDGLGNTVSNFSYQGIMGDNDVQRGFFGYIDDYLGLGDISNIGLTDVSMFNTKYASGALVGSLDRGSVSNSYATGKIETENEASGVGGLIGSISGFNPGRGIVSNSFFKGVVSAGAGLRIGGLVGQIVGEYGTVKNSHVILEAKDSISSVSGKTNVGGLVGSNAGTIVDSYVKKTNLENVSSYDSSTTAIGGLVGLNTSTGNISNSYSLVPVEAQHGQNIGGLVGDNKGTIKTSYVTTTKVKGEDNIGGFVGLNDVGALIEDSYVRSGYAGNNTLDPFMDSMTVEAGSMGKAGGFVGHNKGTIRRAYVAVEKIVNDGWGYNIGGFAGSNRYNYDELYENFSSGTIENSFWNNEISSLEDSSNTPYTSVGIGRSPNEVVAIDQSLVSGKMTLELKTKATYTNAGWDVVGIDGLYPSLTFGIGENAAHKWQIIPLSVNYNLSALNYVYNNTVREFFDWYEGNVVFGSAYSNWLWGEDYIFKYNGNEISGFKDAGIYSGITVEILKEGYIAASSGNTTGTVTIDKASLTVKANNKYALYNGTAVSGGNGVQYSTDGNYYYDYASLNDNSINESGIVYGGTGQGAINAGTYTLTVSGITSDNYNISYVDTSTLTIGKKNITAITGITAENKIYDGTNSATLVTTGASFSEIINGDNLTVATGTGTFSDANAEDGKTVNISGLTLGGTSALNYNLVNTTSSTTANIAKKDLTITAASKTKTYGDANPNLTYTLSENLIGSDTLSGNLSTTASQYSNVGTYNITSNLSNSNYNITYVDANLTIGQRAISITADEKLRVYGDENPELTYSITSGNLVNNDTLSGTLSTIATQYSDIGNYDITSTLANSNYNITYDGANRLLVDQREITVTADAKTKTYGDINPTLTYQITSGSVVNNDNLGSLSTQATQYSDVGTYEISESFNNYNYLINFVGADLTINKKDINILGLTAENKIYDGTNSATLVTTGASFSEIINGDNLTVATGTGTFSDANAEDGKTVNISGLTLGGTSALNYNLVNTTSSTTANIAKKDLTITAASKTKTYGDANPNLTYTLSENLIGSDTLSGNLSTTASQYSNVGTYNITSNLSNSNYNITYVDANLTIGQRAISITADEKLRVYGDENPELTYSITSGNLVNNDTLSGTLSTIATQYSDIGNYDITSTLANSNYNITYDGANRLLVDQREITVTADAKTKTYGDINPTLTYQITSGSVVNNDNLGSLSTQATQYSDVGTYEISESFNNYNYLINFVGADLTINKKDINILGLTAENKIYDGTNSATLVTTGASFSEIINGDNLTVATGTGTFSDANAEDGKTVNISGLTLGGTSALNYNLVNTTSSTTANIAKKDLTITAASKTKTYGDANPNLTYTLSENLIGSDTLSGNLSTTASQYSNVGTYNITSNLSNSNYNITYVDANLTIGQRAISITADEKLRVYGDENPELTYSITSGNLVNNDTLSGTLSTIATQYSDIGNYDITSTLANSNYNITYDGANRLLVDQREITVTADAKTKTYGDINPTLTYQITSGSVVNNDNLGSLSTQATQYSDVGTYEISESFNNYNYLINFVGADLTINKKDINILGLTAENKVYDGLTNVTLNGTATLDSNSIVNGDNISISGTVTGNFLDKNAGENKSIIVGGLTIEGAKAGNYNVGAVTGLTANITKANATVIANSDLTKVYNGLSQSVSGFTASGLVNGETTSVLSGVSGATATGTNAGTYTTNLAGTDENYNLTFQNGTLEIAKANATVIANSDLTKVYNGLSQSVSGFTASGLVNGETTSVLSGVSGATAIGTNAGTYTTNLAGTDENYNLTFQNGTLEIAKANATVIANSDLTKVYNGLSQSVSGFTASGLVNGETTSVLSGVSGATAIGTNAGTYTTNLAGTDENYNLTFQNGTLEIAKANATVIANSDLTKVYNGLSQSVSGFTASGLVNGETTSVLSGVSGATAIGTNAGTYTTNLAGTDENYNLTFQNGTLEIAKANATVIANSDLTKVYNGLSQSVSGFTASGLVNGETTSVLSGVSGATAIGTNAGTYTTNLAGTDENYNLTFQNGTLEIAKANATVIANSDLTKVYNGLSQSVSGFTASGLVNGETTSVLSGVSGATAIGTNAGTYTTNLAGTDENYNLTFQNGTLEIAKANATVIANSDLTKVYNGLSQSVSGFTASGLVNGETTSVLSGVSGATATGTNAGTYTTNLAGTDENYNLTFQNGTLEIAKANATVIANSDLTKVYNGLSQSVSGFTASGLVNGETTSVLSGVSGATATGTNAGTYTTNLAGTDENYNLTFQNGTLEIAKANATVIANSDLTKVYNGLSQSVSGFTASGLVNGETTSVLSGVSGATATGTNAGTYTTNLAGTDENYNLTFQNGTLEIKIKPLTSQVILNKTNETTGIPIKLDGILSDELISQGTKIVVLDASNNDVTQLAKEGKIQPGKYSVKAVNDDINYALNSNEIELIINPALDPITVIKTQIVQPVIPQIITPVVNAPVTQTQISNNLSVKLGITDTGSVNLVSQTVVGQPNQVVTLSELKTETTQTNEEKNTQVQDVRVSLNQNSVVELVNGGVNLPEGVDQEFYVVRQDDKKNNGAN